MNRKLLIPCLGALLAVAVAVPALGASSSVTPTVSGDLAVRALAKARLALLTARSAKSQSRVAVRTAQAATNTANEAKSAAATTQAALDSTRIQSGFAAGTVSTESRSYVQLPGGPSVSVNVPPSGLIEVWAQVTFEENGGVGLFEDGQLVPGQTPHCGPGEEGRGLLASFIPEGITLATPGSDLGAFCGTDSPPAGVLFQTTPGHHTYELRYASCGCTPEAIFSKRRLFVAPRL